MFLLEIRFYKYKAAIVLKIWLYRKWELEKGWMNCSEKGVTYKKSPSEFLLHNYEGINPYLINNMIVLCVAIYFIFTARHQQLPKQTLQYLFAQIGMLKTRRVVWRKLNLWWLSCCTQPRRGFCFHLYSHYVKSNNCKHLPSWHIIMYFWVFKVTWRGENSSPGEKIGSPLLELSYN